MKRLLAIIAVIGLVGLAPASNASSRVKEAEGCQVANPVQPTCTFKVTHPAESPVAGIAGVGSWEVTVKAGKKVTKYKSPATGEPTVVEEVFPTGATVTMKALTPGSAGTAGHAD